MLANFFGKSNPANFIIIFLIFLGIYFMTFFSSFSLSDINSSLIIYQLSVLGLFLLMFFFFNFILTKNKLTLYNSYGFLMFILLFGFFPKSMLGREQILLNLVLLIFLRRVYSLRSSKNSYKKILDAGFWLGFLFLVEPTSVLFGLLIFIAVSLFQKLNARTFLIPFVGFLIPVFCYFTYCFWFDKTAEFTQLFLWYSEYNYENYITSPIMYSLIFLGIITISSIIIKTPKVLLISGNYRKYWTLIIFNFLIATLIITIQKTHTSEELILLFFPVSIIITNWLEDIQKPLFKNLILWLFLVSPLIIFII